MHSFLLKLLLVGTMLAVISDPAQSSGASKMPAPTAAFVAAAQSLSSRVVRQIVGSVREGSLARFTAVAAPSAATMS